MQMEDLINKLNTASEAYYNSKEPIMSDKKYDDLYDRLVKIEQDTGNILPNSPTQHVGYQVVPEMTKIKHEYPSLSLDKTKDKDVLAQWLDEELGVLSWKLDGLTVILTYENGRLISAATRGDGKVGENVMHNAVHFKNLPVRIEDKRHIVVRGEAVIPYETFKTINEALPGDKQYKNPRGMASGATRQLDATKSATYGVTFIPFDLVNARELGCITMSGAMEFIEKLGMKPVEWTIVDSGLIAGTMSRKEEEVKTLPYSTDGLVLVYDDLFICEDLGATSKYPRYAKAFKWADTLKTTVLRDIEWSRAESGLISPIAMFDPVELEGTIVKRASLHNLSVMEDLKLGIGDHINVYKAGMIIPQIHESIEQTGNIKIPTICPICGLSIERRLGANGKSEFLYCTNQNCLTKGEKS